MKKFWAMKENPAGTSDIYIYGDIVSDSWKDSDVTAKSFVDDLKKCKGSATVHLNSGGGDVFQALAIANSLKNYSGDVTISVEGICASAATIIACGSGGHVKAASNSIFMIHNPAVGLIGFYDADELSKVQNSLSTVTESIIATYESRIKGGDIRSMIKAETWMTATEAQALGFVDEITDAVEMKADDSQQMLFVNSLAVSTKKFDAEKMRRVMEAKTMEVKDDKNFWDKLTATVAKALAPAEIETPAPVVDAAAIRQQELSRIRELQGLKCENSAVNAIIDVAIGDGRSAADVQPFVDALKKIPQAPAQDAADKIVAVIRDQMQSGAEGVKGSQEQLTAEDKQKMQAKRIADFANGLI